MQFAHLLHDRKVFHIESLDLIRKLIMVSTLACLELRSGSGVSLLKITFHHDSIHLFLHLFHLLMSHLAQPESETFLQLVLDKLLAFASAMHCQIAVPYLVPSELQQQHRSLIIVTF